MKLQLRSIIQPGELSKERLTLKALADLDVGDYMVAQSGYRKGAPTTHFYHTLWFPFKRISKGDLVVVYTKEGSERDREISSGNIAHFFYLDLDKPIWDYKDRGAIVLYAPSWDAQSTDDLTK